MTLKPFMPQRQMLACKSPRQSQGLLRDMAGNKGKSIKSKVTWVTRPPTVAAPGNVQGALPASRRSAQPSLAS